MKKTEKLFILAEELGIEIYFNDLSIMNCLGFYIESEGLKPCILIDHSIKNNEKELYKVLAEELGHHYTYVGDSISNTSTYRKILDINKCELKAEKWLCEFLITEDELINAFNNSITNIHELAEYLDVDVEILLKRLEYLSLQKQTLKISDTKQLVLTNLPNIYFYEDIYL